MRDALVALLAVTDCAEVTDQDLAGITEALDLSDEGLTVLRQEDFSGLTNLGQLSLNDNALTDLPGGVFDGLGELDRLNLNGNNLETLRAGLFTDLAKVTRLTLSGNQLTSLPARVFAGVGSEVAASGMGGLWLFLDDNMLSSLPPRTFSGTDGLRWLRLGDNDLDGELPPGVFSGLPDSLQALDLGGNPGAPFSLKLRVEFAGGPEAPVSMPGGTVPAKVTLREGAPYQLEFDILLSAGQSSSPTGVIPAGDTETGIFTVTRPAGTEPTEVSLTNIRPSSPPNVCALSERTSGQCFNGFEIHSSLTLVLGDELSAVSRVAVTSDPRQGDTYIGGDPREEIVVEVGFDGPVDVVRSQDGNWPSLALEIGVQTRLAAYDENQGLGTDLVFRYKPQSSDDDKDGISVLAGALMLNGARILDQGVPVSVDLTDHAIENDAEHKVENVEAICDRTSQVQMAILEKLAGVDDCVTVTNEDLSGVTGALNLASGGITSLKEGDFSELANLQNLYLNDNQLSTLPASVFGGLAQLLEIRLQENMLGEGDARGALPVNLFTGLDNLQTLRLHDNQLSTLPAAIFSGLNNLETLRLENNRLEMLPAGVFSGISNLGALHLGGNRGGGGDFEFPLRLELDGGMRAPPPAFGPTTLRATLHEGAPYPLTLRIQTSNGRLSSDGMTIAAGSTQSGSVTVTPGSGVSSVTVEFIPPLPPPPSECRVEQQSGGQCFSGFDVVFGAAFVFGAELSTVLSVEITSSPLQGDTYIGGDPGEEIVVEVNLEEPVEVIRSQDGPSLALEIGVQTRFAAYDENRSSGTKLVFLYQPQSNDGDSDGISVPADELRLNGARILAREVPVSLDLSGHAIENAAGHKVLETASMGPRSIEVVWEPEETTLTRGRSGRVLIQAVPDLRGSEQIAVYPRSQSSALTFRDSSGGIPSDAAPLVLAPADSSRAVLTIEVNETAEEGQTTVSLTRSDDATRLGENVDLNLEAALVVTIEEGSPGARLRVRVFLEGALE